jgi:hypothetical protein
VLQKALDGLFAALSGWRAVENHLVRLPADQARAEATKVPQGLSPEFPVDQADTARWIANPTELRRLCVIPNLRRFPDRLVYNRVEGNNTTDKVTPNWLRVGEFGPGRRQRTGKTAYDPGH